MVYAVSRGRTGLALGQNKDFPCLSFVRQNGFSSRLSGPISAVLPPSPLVYKIPPSGGLRAAKKVELNTSKRIDSSGAEVFYFSLEVFRFFLEVFQKI